MTEKTQTTPSPYDDGWLFDATVALTDVKRFKLNKPLRFIETKKPDGTSLVRMYGDHGHPIGPILRVCPDVIPLPHGDA